MYDSTSLAILVLIALTGIVSCICVIRSLYFTHERLGAPLLLGLLWIFFYVYYAFNSYSVFPYALPAWCFAAGELLALLGIISAVSGWYVGTGRIRENKTPIQTMTPRVLKRLWAAGAALACTGAFGAVYFKLAHNNDLSESNGYVASLFQAGFPGLTLCITSTMIMKRRASFSRWPIRVRIALTAALAVIFIAPQLITLRRGPIFAFSAVLLYSVGLFGKRLTISRMLGGACCTGAIMLAMLPIRSLSDRNTKDLTYLQCAELILGGFSQIGINDVVASKTQMFDDNEYIYHSASIGTNISVGGFQYGTGYLLLLAHWVPRKVWAEKPETGEAIFPSVRGRISEVFGWKMSAVGAAGGVADTFEELGPLFPLFWFVLLFYLGRTFSTAWSKGCYRSATRYICIISTTHWMVMQDFRAAFVPACLYLACLEVCFRLAKVPSIVPVTRPSATRFQTGRLKAACE